MTTEQNNEIKFGNTEAIWIDHERRIGKVEAQIPALVQTFEMMRTSFDDLKVAVITGHEKSMNFMQHIIKHEQGIEQTRMEFEQRLQTIKIEAQEKQLVEESERRKTEEAARVQREEFERQQKIEKETFERNQKQENRALVHAGIKRFVTWFAPLIVAVVTALVAWLNSGGFPN